RRAEASQGSCAVGSELCSWLGPAVLRRCEWLSYPEPSTNRDPPRRSTAGGRHRSPATAQSRRGCVCQRFLSLRMPEGLRHCYQSILKTRPPPVITQLKEILAKPDQTLGYYNGELRFWLGWAQEVAGDREAARESWSQARRELEPFLKEQPENFVLLGDLALTSMSLGDNTAALALAERAIAMMPIEKDTLTGPRPLEILARVAARIPQLRDR